MSFLGATVLFVCTWWMIFFMLLPVGNKAHQDERFGTAGSAPENPRLGKKTFWTTALTLPIWIGIMLVIHWRGGL